VEIAVSELKGVWRRRPVLLRVQLPRSEVHDTLDEQMQRAIVSFCERRKRYNDNEIRAMNRDGVGALVIGVLLLIVGLAGYKWCNDYLFNEGARLFFADGIFLVIAWVAMWYPLDKLVYYTRPTRLENRALDQLAEAELVIEAVDYRSIAE
jgi:hypothetical protein